MSFADNRIGSGFGSRFRGDYEEFCGKVSEDFISKLQIDGADDRLQLREPEGEASEQNSRDSFESAVSDQQHEEDEEEEDEESEFSFACVNPDGSPVSADDVFQNGKIRPIYPLFDRSILYSDSQDEAPESTAEASCPRPPLKKLFVEKSEMGEVDGLEEGTYCVWNGKTVEEVASAEGCRKSNSTGFSRLWRFRDLVHRSSSDGKNAFVFLNAHGTNAGGGKVHRAKKDGEVSREKVGSTAASKEGKAKTTAVTAKVPTAHEKHYIRNKAAKEGDRRKSYLPYRQNLVGVGFFANVNGMTRNVHPF